MAIADDKKTDFLRFSAYSMKDLITRKLSQDSKFTDQIYEGSNLAILIDLVSYMYQCLVYQLNNAASESMFADTQIFTNINRLVKLLGYNVKGCSPASVNVKIIPKDQSQGFLGMIIPAYSRLHTNMTDRNGRQICFSTTAKDGQGYEKSSSTTADRADDDPTKVLALYNGVWNMYSKTLVASGEENETFVLEGIMSNSSAAKPSYVATNFIDVYVKPAGGKWEKWKNDPNGVFINQKNDDSIFNDQFVSMYTSKAMVYTAYLNENKTYEIKFGDGVVGKKLQRGDLIRVFYLDTNGPDGEIDLTDVDRFNDLKLQHDRFMFPGLSEEDYKQIFGLENDSINLLTQRKYTLNTAGYQTGTFVPEENVSKIRYNAPEWFKTGSRLVTRSDYEYYIKNVVYVRDSIPGIVVQDVKCMNNVEYMSTFYKWLYLHGKNYHGDGRYYFNQTKFWNRGEFKLADPADANNIYVWIKSTATSTTQESYEITDTEIFLNEKLAPVKSMTAEIQVLKPVLVDFDVCANTDEDDVKARYIQDSEVFDSSLESYIEVTLDNEKILAAESIRQQVYDVIAGYFSVQNCVLGQVVQTASMLDEIYGIGGVKNVRTVF